jgi:hypothetical protein
VSNWTVIGPLWNDDSELAMDYIKAKTGEYAKFFALYSTMMAFIRHAGLDENKVWIYRDGQLVGTFETLKAIL